MPDESVFSELEKYQTDHLILLIGGNPLPNAVAALLLAQENTGSVSLVFSQGNRRRGSTSGVANNLKTFLLKPKHGFTDQRVSGLDKGIDIDRPDDIIQHVKTILSDYAGKVDSIGLNYTGGTKNMAVHAYRAVEMWQRNTKNHQPFDSVVFSYLNPRTMQMQVERVTANQTKFETVYVANSISLDADDLGLLHERDALFSKDNPELSRPILREVSVEIANLYASGDKKTWKKFKGNFQGLELPNQKRNAIKKNRSMAKLDQQIKVVKENYPNYPPLTI